MRAYWNADIPSFYDEATSEAVLPVAPVTLGSDFLAGVDSPFTARTAGGGTVTALAESGGVVRLALTSTDEAQCAAVDLNDKLPFEVGRNLIIEARVKLVAEMGAGVVMALGLETAHSADPNATDKAAWYRINGDAEQGDLLTCSVDDGVAAPQSVLSGLGMMVNVWHILRVDCSNAGAVAFFYNGTRAASNTTFAMTAANGALVQPVVRLTKASGTGVGTLDIDYIRAWQARA